MYFPYVRGRQYELLALRELAQDGILSAKIIPIIEPVKLSSTLLKTMEVFINNGRKFIILCNPAVGNFMSDMNNNDVATDKSKATFFSMLRNENILKGHIEPSPKKWTENEIKKRNES